MQERGPHTPFKVALAALLALVLGFFGFELPPVEVKVRNLLCETMIRVDRSGFVDQQMRGSQTRQSLNIGCCAVRF
jgi:hypothetical protein